VATPPLTVPEGEATAFTFAHLSDPHLSSLEQVQIRDLLNKRVLGYLSWWFHRRAEHRPEILAALLRDLARTPPEHIVVTGDLTHLGLPGEFREVSEWLHRVGPPAQVTVIPGNHDAYVKTAWEHTFAWWAPYMASDAGVLPAGASAVTVSFPSLRIRGPIAFIGLSTACPSAPFAAVGSLGRAQLRRLEQILVQLKQQNLFRVILLHHPPQPRAVKWGKRLTDSAALRSVLARHGAELVLHGHAHYPLWGQLATPHGSAPVIGVPSASALGRKPERRARYHLYRVCRTADGWDLQISVRGYLLSENRFIVERESQLMLPLIL
jgi:3',5'-cyclic AMP phosphodiesterase CpdA